MFILINTVIVNINYLIAIRLIGNKIQIIKDSSNKKIYNTTYSVPDYFEISFVEDDNSPITFIDCCEKLNKVGFINFSDTYIVNPKFVKGVFKRTKDSKFTIHMEVDCDETQILEFKNQEELKARYIDLGVQFFGIKKRENAELEKKKIEEEELKNKIDTIFDFIVAGKEFNKAKGELNRLENKVE